eukprot:gene11558-12749_t
MAADNRFAAWKEDELLRTAMQEYVKQGLKREETLSFSQRDFSHYKWSMRTLDRRMRHFQIYYIDQDVSIEEVKEAVKKELAGPGKLLGYRAMQKKIRINHNFYVGHDKVYDMMTDLDQEGLAARGGVAVYGCLDTASRKLLWLRVWMSNHDPLLIARWYLEYLMETNVMSSMLRVDKGTETGTMATMHAFLRSNNHEDEIDPVDTVIYGPSTPNQIERWWKELHERLEKFFKVQLNELKNHAHYNPDDDVDSLFQASLLSVIVARVQIQVFKFFFSFLPEQFENGSGK